MIKNKDLKSWYLSELKSSKEYIKGIQYGKSNRDNRKNNGGAAK